MRSDQGRKTPSAALSSFSSSFRMFASFLEGKKVSPPVADFIRRTNKKKLRSGKMPDYIGIIKILGKFNLLPAIFF